MAAHPKKKIPGAKEFIQVDPQKLIALRGERGFTQKSLSAATKIRRRSISCLEDGSAKSASAKTIEALCEALNCRPADITTRYFYEDPAAGRAKVTNFKDHRSVDLSIFGIGRKYLINGKKLILDEKSPGKGVIHFVFRQVSTGWPTSYTDIDFYVGDVSVQPL